MTDVDIHMATRKELEDALVPLNGRHFSVPDLPGYVDKLLQRACFIEDRCPDRGSLRGFLAWYDDTDEAFVSMLWTAPDHRRTGLAKRLINRLITATTKDVALEVHPENPARLLYESNGFVGESLNGSALRMRRPQRVAIMQPYVFPYLGYFSLAHAATHFVFLDDVNFPKKGWVNRNRVLLDGKPHTFSIPLHRASQNRRIDQIRTSLDPRWVRSWLSMLRSAYSRSCHFDLFFPKVVRWLEDDYESIADMAIASVSLAHECIGLPFRFSRASTDFSESRGQEAPSRLAGITRQLGMKRYINLPGGRNLYSHERFCDSGVTLEFIEPELAPYPQASPGFTPALSVLDALMNLPPGKIAQHVRRYTINRAE